MSAPDLSTMLRRGEARRVATARLRYYGPLEVSLIEYEAKASNMGECVYLPDAHIIVTLQREVAVTLRHELVHYVLRSVGVPPHVAGRGDYDAHFSAEEVCEFVSRHGPELLAVSERILSALEDALQRRAASTRSFTDTDRALRLSRYLSLPTQPTVASTLLDAAVPVSEELRDRGGADTIPERRVDSEGTA
jgi:hypothetical protein